MTEIVSFGEEAKIAAEEDQSVLDNSHKGTVSDYYIKIQRLLHAYTTSDFCFIRDILNNSKISSFILNVTLIPNIKNKEYQK